jgi:hypothetical protein
MPLRTTNRSTTASMVVPFVLVEPNPLRAVQLHNLTVKPGAHESFAPDLLYYVPKFPWLIVNQG